jgi:hypothetical protein
MDFLSYSAGSFHSIAFGVRRLVAAFFGWTTCRPASLAENPFRSDEFRRLNRGLPALDGDKSPAESDHKSSHFKAFTRPRLTSNY